MKKSNRYDHTKIEKKWQSEWAKKKVYKTLDPEKAKKKPKYYALDMFPYPSGEGLHVGHPKGYIATDVVSRMKRMQGFNVLHPMGFDAFGLPAEQYAIKMKVNPAIAVKKNVARYKKQLEILGLDYDWSREVNTTDPKFYKWTQWIFLKLMEKELAYESFEPINWCPTCKTGLANEDLEDGKCERCGTPVEKKPMRQWVLRITDYADRLLKDLDANDYIIPAVVDHVNPPRKDKKDVVRKNVHAIVYDPSAKKYLILRNKKHGWDTVIIGGIEEGESAEQAARRELEEETGYVDLQFKRQLGGEVKASYFAKHKDVNRVAYSTGLYFELKSSKQVPVATDGDNEGNEITWIDEADFVPGKMVNSELPLWLERLTVEVTKDAKGIPCFTDVRGSSGFKKDMPTIERNAIVAIVKHWSKDEYIGLKWKKVNWQTVITGGIEDGQTAEEAAIAEIREETGYQNPKLVRTLGNVDAKFFHVPKNVNRNGHFTVMYFELQDSKRAKITTEEEGNHELVWVKKEEMTDFLNAAAQKYLWQTLFLGEPSRYMELSKPLLNWPESIKEAQKNWIGRSEGAEIDFAIKDRNEKITVFTTRADTIFGVTYIVLAPEGELAWKLSRDAKNKNEIEKYIAAAKAKTEIERTDAKKQKTGVVIEGVKAINPANGEEIPVWVADYVLSDYGTGSVMAVPAHDERDAEFSKAYNLPVKEIELEDKHKMTEKYGRRVVKYKLRDWVFSRQRYWGEPIPVYHKPNGAIEPLSEKELPLVLPPVKSYEPTGTGESPLAAISKWVNVKKGKEIWKRETNTMPQWAGSSWYYLRYMDPNNNKQLVDAKKEKYWNQTDLYVGGAEHATRHLIYARFWHKFLYDLGVVSTIEPFGKLQNVGLIMAEDGRKMSKRWGSTKRRKRSSLGQYSGGAS